MKLDSQQRQLRNRVLEAIDQPLTSVGAAALDSFVALPRVGEWSPQNLYLLELSTVFDIGLPFSLLAGNTSADAHRRAVGAAIGRNEKSPTSLLSEVHAGALLSKWGASVRFVPRTNFPTADIEADGGDGVNVDVEVVRGDTRKDHQAVQSGLAAFGGALRASDVTWNLAAFMRDASNHTDLASMFDAATNLRPGLSAEEPGKWFVCAIELDRRDDVVGSSCTELFGPGWWPDDEPNYCVTSTLIGTVSNPVINLRSLVPLAPYTNPLLRKASGRQRNLGNPFLIAFDVTELPRAHERLVNDLNGYFEIWDHVSAVLLFEPRFWTGYEHKTYVVSVHPNPKAGIAIPHFLRQLPTGERFNVEFVISHK